jgi:hypothetical protein
MIRPLAQVNFMLSLLNHVEIRWKKVPCDISTWFSGPLSDGALMLEFFDRSAMARWIQVSRMQIEGGLS